MNPRYVTLKAEQNGEVRTEKYLGRDWTVVPVVALVEGVIHAMNASTPELVLASTYSKAPTGWNGRPIFIGHPLRDGKAVSGNTPEILEEEGSGQVFNAGLKKGKLVMEAWLDNERAASVPKLKVMLKRIDEKEPVEISVGALVETNDVKGEYEGKTYEGQWVDIIPDHLALLEAGDLGACSRDMGCGVRAAQGEAVVKTIDKTLGGVFRRMMEAFRSVQPADEMSDNDLRRKLYEATMAIDGSIGWVEAIYAEKSEYVYCTYGATMGYKKRSYQLAENGTVTVAEEAEDVEPVLTYPTKAETEARNAAAGAPCSCHKPAPTAASTATSEETATMDRKARVKALAPKLASVFTETELEGKTDEQLAQLEKLVETPAPAAPATPAATTEVKTEAPAVAAAAAVKTPTFDELLASADPATRDAIVTARAAGEQKKTATIKALKDSGRCDLTDEQLKAMSQVELDKLVKLAQVTPNVDFGAAGAPKAQEEKQEVPPPADLTAALKNKSAK